jgi:hypothetical protein
VQQIEDEKAVAGSSNVLGSFKLNIELKDAPLDPNLSSGCNINVSDQIYDACA